MLFRSGTALGKGGDAAAILGGMRTVAEGAFTAPVLHSAALAIGVDMPVVGAVCALLSGTANVDQVVTQLLTRPLKPE